VTSPDRSAPASGTNRDHQAPRRRC
jgi:hypothetical protein